MELNGLLVMLFMRMIQYEFFVGRGVNVFGNNRVVLLVEKDARGEMFLFVMRREGCLR